MEQYLKEHYYDEITLLLNDTNDRTHASLQVDLSKLQQHNFDWFQAILVDVHHELPKWDAALFAAQKSVASEDEGFLEIGYQIKVNCHVRFVRIPPPDARFKLPFPNHDQIGLFCEVKGTVVRMTQVRLLEFKREFICTKCHSTCEISADYSLMYRFDVPKSCAKPDCKGSLHQKHVDPLPQHCVNFQELKIQEALSEKNIPPTLTVTLELDLVDSCQPGDCVTICGTIERRWISFQYEGRCDATIAMRAVSLTREQNSLNADSRGLSEQLMTLKADWIEHLNKHGELGMRDIILKSICPDVFGMFPVKLAIALAICSGNEISDIKSNDGLHQRGQSHILLVGDPGLAKSKLLLNAVQIAPRAVHTTGMGCSTAGLTAAAIKEEGEWVLEAGALVLADGGICCIDEFNLMRDSDRASIHEAMEQQTISMAKAGIVCKLNTRCAILAAANPKNLNAMSDPDGTSSINIGIATPLLSRFDLVFILRDERIPEWDDAISNHLLAQAKTGFKGFQTDGNNELWSEQKLQSHFDAISQVQPKMTPIASAILSAYYQKCRMDPERDLGRTTIRLLDSLNRLAEAHARLVFRENITAIDAIVTIRLMESTFGFGRIVKPYDVIKEILPFGPEEDEIKCILEIFEIDKNIFIDSPQTSSSTIVAPSQSTKSSPTVVPLSKTPKPATVLATLEPTPSKALSQKSNESNLPPTVDMDLDALDEVLSFEDTAKDKKTINEEETNKSSSQIGAKTTVENTISDDEDLILSQALDKIESSHSPIRSPLPKKAKISKTTPNRLALNLGRFAFVPPKKSPVQNRPVSPTTQSNQQENRPITQKNTQAQNQPTRNRIFCTPSDSESSQSEPSTLQPIRKRPFQLNKFKPRQKSGQRQILQQQNAAATTAAKGEAPQPEHDSAYDSMLSGTSISSSATFGSAAKTAKTPPIFPPSKTTPHSLADQDLSFLDDFEF